MVKIIIIDKTFRHLGLSFRQVQECIDKETAIATRDKILANARDYGADVKVIIKI